MKNVVLGILTLLLVATGASRAAAHDVPAELSITGFFDVNGERPELILRVPLILLGNIDLPKRGPGYLDLENLDEGLASAERAVAAAFRIDADGEPLHPVRIDSRISLPSEQTFGTAEAARSAILGPPLAATENVFWNQGFFDVRMVFDPQPPGQTYTLLTNLPAGIAERSLVTLEFRAPEKSPRTLSIAGTTPEIVLDPRWYQAGVLFMTKGVEHILIGYDHLLFLLCLILPLRGDLRRLVGVVTAFTLGHSATLIPAALGLAPAAVWFLPLIETLIAASIVYMALENLLGFGSRFRWGLAFGFGLIHGFGFASTLTDMMQFAGGHLLSSLVFFNIGIELGQVLVLAAALPVLALIFRSAGIERSGMIVISVLAGHEAWHWTVERAGGIRFDFVGFGEAYAALTWIGLALLAALLLALALSAARSRGAPAAKSGTRTRSSS